MARSDLRRAATATPPESGTTGSPRAPASACPKACSDDHGLVAPRGDRLPPPARRPVDSAVVVRVHETAHPKPQLELTGGLGDFGVPRGKTTGRVSPAGMAHSGRGAEAALLVVSAGWAGTRSQTMAQPPDRARRPPSAFRGDAGRFLTSSIRRRSGRSPAAVRTGLSALLGHPTLGGRNGETIDRGVARLRLAGARSGVEHENAAPSVTAPGGVFRTGPGVPSSHARWQRHRQASLLSRAVNSVAARPPERTGMAVSAMHRCWQVRANAAGGSQPAMVLCVVWSRPVGCLPVHQHPALDLVPV
jgi:hypothetical protein